MIILSSSYNINFPYGFKSLFLPRVAEFIYIEGDNKRMCSFIVSFNPMWNFGAI